MSNKIYLYGASGHAKVIIDILKSQNKKLTGLVDDNEAIKEILEYPVSQTLPKDASVIVSIGDNKIREKVVNQLSDNKFETAIHSSAIVSEYSSIEEGTVVMQGAIIQSSCKVGKQCIINTGASVDHDCQIGDFVHISPQAILCGNVTVGEGTWIGAGSTIIEGVTIGKWCVIGAGSVVTKDIPDNRLAVGNRCKIIKEINT